VTCPHQPPALLARFAPVPCEQCGGWVEANGNVMDRQTTIERYPFMAQLIDQGPAMPDTLYRAQNPTTGDVAFHRVSVAGKLARTGLLIFSGLSVVLLIYTMVKVLSSLADC
jgi:hypothetical protein